MIGLAGQVVLVTGAEGMLGSAFADILGSHGQVAAVHALGRDELDVTDLAHVARARRLQPDVIIHCAGLADMDRCEREPAECQRVHVGGTRQMVALATEVGARLVYPQSVFAFGATPPRVLTEATVPTPDSAYGQAKLAAERLVLEADDRALVIRMAGFFGGEHRDKNFVGTFSRHLADLTAQGGGEVGVGDRIWQPTSTRDLAANTLQLIARGCTGVYHMASHGEAAFFEVAERMVAAFGVGDRIRLVRRPAAEFASREAAPRPLRIVIDNARLRREGLDHQRAWEVALDEYLAGPYFQELFRTAVRAGETDAD